MNRALAMVFVAAAAARITYDDAFVPLGVPGPGWRGELVPLDEEVIERSGVIDCAVEPNRILNPDRSAAGVGYGLHAFEP